MNTNSFNHSAREFENAMMEEVHFGEKHFEKNRRNRTE
jgi:hypothetical protein